jgi:hypothetical protein
MPAQHGLRLDDEQRLLPVLEYACKEREETTFGWSELRAFERTVKDDELLP